MCIIRIKNEKKNVIILDINLLLTVLRMYIIRIKTRYNVVYRVYIFNNLFSNYAAFNSFNQLIAVIRFQCKSFGI